MIIGIGTDIVNINRIDELMARYGERFLQRVFTAGEIAYCDSAKGERRIIRYANRFAAKEACLKAIGLKVGISWQHIEVRNDINSKPYLILHNQAHKSAQIIAGEEYKLHLSLSDDVPYATAFVVLEQY
jgi:holo-[acyl-carrier protein] synthase